MRSSETRPSWAMFPEKIDTTPLITHRYKLADIAEAYHLFENKLDGVIKVAVEP